jgi:ferredoxin
MKFWPLNKTANWLGNQPLVGRLVQPVFSREDYESIILPVHQAVHADESIVLPYKLLAPLVEKSDARVLLNKCICRSAEKCDNFPIEIGCLFLGEGAREIDGGLGREVDAPTAWAHVQHAMDAKLVPLVVHASFDAFVLGIPYRRMLAICFCCDCCCTIRHGLRLGPRAFWDTVIRLPGMTIDVSEDCIGCGKCVEVCPVKAIHLDYGSARVDEQCKGCGRCVEECATGAMTVRLDRKVDILKGFLERIEERTDIGRLNGHKRKFD